MNGSTGRFTWVGGALAAVALFASACASSGNGGSGGGSSPANAAGGGGSSATTSGVEIETHSGPMGTFLTDGAGKSLYLFASDSATKSSCNGACVAYWAPVPGPAHEMSGATGTLTVITRSDGSKQAVYAGHPLYYYREDTAAGDTKGQGSDNFGAKWWLVSPSGKAITTTGSGAGSSSSSGGGGGSWS